MLDLISWRTHLAASTVDDSCAMAARAAANKLQAYTEEKKQHASRFLKAVRVLDPKQLAALDISSYASLKADLRLSDDCDQEWPIYIGLAGDIGQSTPAPLSFWKAVQQRVPNLAARAILLLQVPINSADVERSFSGYNQLLTAQRQSLKEESIAGLLKLYFNRM